MCPSVRPSSHAIFHSHPLSFMPSLKSNNHLLLFLLRTDCAAVLHQHLLLTRPGESLEFDDFVRHEIVIRVRHIAKYYGSTAFVRLLVQLTSGRP